jgi:NADH:ubiquinone oxidoreductase subunit K
MKNYFYNRYKLINAILFVGVLCTFIFIDQFVKNGHCIDYCSVELKKGLLNPLHEGGKILAVVFGALLLVPSHIFRKWLFIVAPVMLLITYILVSDISVYSGNFLNPTRGKMAELCMIALAGITVVFVLAHLAYDYRKKKKLSKENG